ncbi:hypothetical protein [Paraburkholderia ultramafica]|uniref:hypothetical protein n=1 Tax=Paraburkholderia ultramafica TaxID=1544867 RepID=UPI001581600D|nr:hypothetical protein [Paraburkholderia ultramafica]
MKLVIAVAVSSSIDFIRLQAGQLQFMTNRHFYKDNHAVDTVAPRHHTPAGSNTGSAPARKSLRCGATLDVTAYAIIACYA